MAKEDFLVLLAPMLPLEVFDRKYLVEYPSIWLSEIEAWLPSDGSKLCTDGSLFEGRVMDSAVFFGGT
jgi:hypothetical protein